MKWYFEVLKKYAVFSGRAQREEYWFFFLISLAISFGLASVDATIGSFNALAGMGLLGGLYTLAVLVPSIAVAVRRLHDTGRNGWWALLILIPLAGVIILIVFMVQDSQPGTNPYGRNPKGVTVA